MMPISFGSLRCSSTIIVLVREKLVCSWDSDSLCSTDGCTGFESGVGRVSVCEGVSFDLTFDGDVDLGFSSATKICNVMMLACVTGIPLLFDVSNCSSFQFL